MTLLPSVDEQLGIRVRAIFDELNPPVTIINNNFINIASYSSHSSDHEDMKTYKR